MVRVIKERIIYTKWPKGKPKTIQVSGNFESSRVRVPKENPVGKETVFRISRFDCTIFLCKTLVTNIKDFSMCVHILGLQISSSILGSDEFLISHLSRFLEPVAGSHSRWYLCWRASMHGWSSSTFHSKCNGRSKTVTIIRKDQYVFGGYTDYPWGENVIINSK